MIEPDWYDVIEAIPDGQPSLLQGDILREFPVATIPEIPWPLPADYKPDVRLELYDVVVLTQSCDLSQDKNKAVLLAAVDTYEKLVQSADGKHQQTLKSSDFRKALVAGNVPGYSLLNKREGIPAMPWSIASFRALFAAPTKFVSAFAISQSPRLRLRSPYREHLSQAFARYFMRVGLPHDVKAFVQEGKLTD
jgi:hypothetical protein